MLACSAYTFAQEPIMPTSNPIKEFLSSFSSINVDAPIKLELIRIGRDEAPYIIYDTKGVDTSKFTVDVDNKTKTLKITERTDLKRVSVTEVKVYFSELTDISISKANVTVEGVIEAELLKNHDLVEVVDGEKIDAASLISAEKFSAETRESLISEVEAGFEMYREDIALKMYNRPLSELTPEEVAALDEALPFQFSR